MVIVSYGEALAEATKSKLETAPNKTATLYRGAIRSIYSLKDGTNIPEQLGTCLLLKLNGVPMLLTAAHIIDEHRTRPLFLGAGRLHPISGDFLTTVAPGGDRKLDRYDFAVQKLPPSIVRALTPRDFITDREVAPALPPPDSFLVAMGYANSKHRWIDIESRKIQTRLWRYGAFRIGDSNRYNELNLNPDHHILMRYQKKSSTPSGRVERSVRPIGASGGAVFNLRRITHPDYLEPNKFPQPLLQGLLIEQIEGEDVIVAVNMRLILDAPEVQRLVA
jgi:hypothetical protein